MFAQWSPTPPKTLSSLIRYIAVSNEFAGLSFALYRSADINACFVNETITRLVQSTEQLLEVFVVDIELIV